MESGGPGREGGGREDGPRRDSRERWYRDPRALVAFAAAVVGLITGVVVLVNMLDKDDPPKPPPRSSAEYIVDVSQGMAGAIGSKPKLPAVAAEVLAHVRNTPSLSTALRLTGPSCSTGYREPDVDFDEDNGERFGRALEGVRPAGRSDFANAVRHAASDFISEKDAASSVSKTLYIFVGGPDTCSSRPVEVIRRALRDLRSNKDLELNLKFVGVEPPPEVRELLDGVGKEAKGLGFTADVVVADDESELEDVLPVRCAPGETEYFDPADMQYKPC